jgi:hypothetical protein
MIDFLPSYVSCVGCVSLPSQVVGVRRWSTLLAVALMSVACAPGRSSEPPPASPASETKPVESTPSGDTAVPPRASSDEAAPRSALQPAPAAGAPMTGSMTKPEAEGMRAKSDELDTLDAEFEHAVSLSSSDCTTPWALRDRICDLAQRLCDIAERSAEVDVQERCKDGRARCERATARVRAACAE